ncbi:MAG: type IV secretory system conjugative DNA transfer family protein [Rickettsia endosymbiont of Glossina mortisans submortisans]|nr:type IV secretory system conjugative DNA transfer family protein [Rickettsia endosymbiont of Glossina mortisans submortisans]
MSVRLNLDFYKLVKYLNPDFVSLGAGTKSGKGASVVIPNLLEWQDSLIVLDIKQECFNITSKYRKEVLKQEVFLFAPFSFNTHKFNPLYYVDLSAPEGSTDLMGLGEIIFPTDSVTGAEKHFNNAAQSLFIALAKSLWILQRHNVKFLQEHLLPSIFSIGNLFGMYSNASIGDISATLTENLELSKLDQSEQMLCNDAIAKLRSFMLLEGEGKASVISTFEKQLKLFSLPVISNATDDNSFDFKDMRRKKMTIYLSVEPKDVKIASLILNLFFNCAIKINLSENPDFKPELKYNLLMILDEFPAIGNIPYVKEAAGYIAGYQLQLLTIFQNVSQLNEIYGMQGRKTLLANHACKIVFAPNEQDDAEYFSNEIAYVTTHSVSESRNQGLRVSSHAESASQAKRALMLPQELKQMPFKEEIVLLNGENPIKCEKALYFNDPHFMKKLISLSPTLRLYTQDNKLPTKEELGIAMSKHELAIKL